MPGLQRSLHRPRHQLLDVLGRQTGRFRLHGDLGRRKLRVDVVGRRPGGVHAGPDEHTRQRDDYAGNHVRPRCRQQAGDPQNG